MVLFSCGGIDVVTCTMQAGEFTMWSGTTFQFETIIQVGPSKTPATQLLSIRSSASHPGASN